MRQLVILNLGKGDCQAGFPTVVLQCQDYATAQFTGALPPAPKLAALHQQWQRFYQARYSQLNRRAVATGSIEDRFETGEFEIDEDDITLVSPAAFDRLCQDLRHCLNEWLLTASFRNLDQKLRTLLSPIDEIRVIVMADSAPVLRLPWHLWQFLDDYPRSELALSPAEYAQSIQVAPTRSKLRVKILVILGKAAGLDLDRDVSLLRQLPQTDLTVLVEPNRTALSQHLWQAGWDILFFAGHSSSREQGQLYLSETLTIDQLKYGLRTAIAHGLKLAIFNSCDGLGLAQDLADLHLPQVIVMRESVPDRVAQAFLQHFLSAFSSGEPLYGAVRQAREKLQDLESEFPCASWLPVICQNPAEVPPVWWDWCRPPIARRRPRRQDLKALLLSSLAVTSLVAGVRWLGLLQPLELGAFDRLMQSRPAELPDDRLLVVTVTEADIQAQKQQPRIGSLSDPTLNQLLQTLESYQPQAIGLDLYRDFPARLPALKAQMQSDRLIGICKRPDPKDDPTGILPPPEISDDRLGFSDFVQDADGAVRRQLMVMSANPTSPCTTPYAFGVQLAFRYLDAQGIAPQFTAAGDLQFGSTIFRRLRSRVGGYQPLDAGGNQILLNYRAAPQAFQQVSVTQILNRQINANAVKNKIVLIGLTTPSSGDAWATPYGRAFSQKLPGVIIHAQMVSQILSAVLDRRPLLWVWQGWGEILWIGNWALLGSILALAFRRFAAFAGSIACAALLLFALCWGLLLQGGWVPLIPPLAALLLSSVVLRSYRQNLHHD